MVHELGRTVENIVYGKIWQPRNIQSKLSLYSFRIHQSIIRNFIFDLMMTECRSTIDHGFQNALSGKLTNTHSRGDIIDVLTKQDEIQKKHDFIK